MPDEMQQLIVGRTRQSLLKEEFLRSLSKDLRGFGLRAGTVRHGTWLSFRVQCKQISHERLLSAIRTEQQRRIDAEFSFIQSMRQRGVIRAFATPEQINVAAIAPRIHFCKRDEDFALFRYCRLMQSVPAPKLLYRQIAALVRDHGQPGVPLIGVFGLTSSVYSMQSRDRALGWSSSPKRKEEALKRCMQLSICMAVPPYNVLRGAKLIAGLAATDEVATEFRKRYGGRTAKLETIIATSATGLHCPMFNRIMLRRGGLYRRIGATTGYSAIVFSRATMHAAAALVRRHDRAAAPETDRSIRLLKRALNLCHVPRERILRLGVIKGVYLARTPGGSGWPSVDEVVEYWRFRELAKSL